MTTDRTVNRVNQSFMICSSFFGETSVTKKKNCDFMKILEGILIIDSGIILNKKMGFLKKS